MAGGAQTHYHVREYLEIAVLHLTLRASARTARLVELVHRAVPYPLLLLTEQVDHNARPGLSAAHKRWSQGDLRATAAKEKQMSRRVELNLKLKLKRVEAAQAAARKHL